MTKTHTVETVEEFDENGKLLKRTVTETDETDDNPGTIHKYRIPVHSALYGHFGIHSICGFGRAFLRGWFSEVPFLAPRY